MFKFLHAADVHLDSPMTGLGRYEGAPVEEARVATRRALENLVSLAVAEQVAFVLLVGDLYDGDWNDYNTGLFFSAQMSRLRDQGIRVYLIRGNHDAANRMTKDLRLLDNVRMLSVDRPETVTLDPVGVAIHGQGYPTRAVTDNIAASYPRRVPGLFNVGLLHTGVDGREGHERYAPCTLDDLRRHDYDYWALGHIHKREILHDAGPIVAFPGNVQGRSVRETGPKGCLLVTVDHAGQATVEPRWLDVLRWNVCRIDASGACDGDDLLDRFRTQLDEVVADLDDRLVALRVEFFGSCVAHTVTSAHWPHWSSEVRQAATERGGGRIWVEKVLARTTPPVVAELPDDDALAELAYLLDDLRGDASLLQQWLDRELEDFKRKNPWVFDDHLDTPERRLALLDQVGPLLFDRLATQR